MDEAKLNDFLSVHHDAVLSTLRSSGDIQLSIVTVGPVENGALITFMSSSDSPIEDNTSSISGSATSSGFAALLGA